MTESSYPWDGTTLGHAAAGKFTAPYTGSLEFARTLRSQLTADDETYGYVIPNTADDGLNVTETAVASAAVLVKTGMAFVKGFLYENDANLTLAIAANASGNPRIDSVILRVDWTTQEIHAAILQGTPAANPSAPSLTQTVGTTYEVLLATIWVANGFATILNPEIHDQRLFLASSYEFAVASNLENKLQNSEFILVNFTTALGAVGNGLPYWEQTGTHMPTAVNGTRLSPAERGRSISYATVGEGHKQSVWCRPNTWYSIKVLVQPGDPAVGYGVVTVTTNSASPGTIIRNCRGTGNTITETIYYKTEADAGVITLSCVHGGGAGTSFWGQAMIVRGRIPGPFRTKHETLFLGSDMPGHVDANWNTTAKSSGTTVVDLSAAWGGRYQWNVHAIYFKVLINDSGSAGGTPEFYIAPGTAPAGLAVTADMAPIHLNITGVPNDAIRIASGWVKVSEYTPGTTVPKLRFVVVASGALTMDVKVVLMGVQS